METLNIGYIQMVLHWEESEKNRNAIQSMVGNSSAKFDVLVLPEMFTTGFSMQPKNIAETMDGETIRWMLMLAKERNCLVLGSIIIRVEDVYFNRCLAAFPEGEIKTYDKRHLFGMGGEQEHYAAGKDKCIFEFRGWKFCPLICYDLRFPVFSRNVEEYDVLIYMANWPETRREAWMTLLKARAIENQCYTIGVNRIGMDGNQLHYKGDSMLVDFNGTVTSYAGDSEGLFVNTMDRNQLHNFRTKLPFLKDQDSFLIQ